MGDFDEAYDNRRGIFSILIQYTDNSEGSSIVQSNERRCNGRKAWKELQRYFEGDTYNQRSAQEAGSISKSASYSGRIFFLRRLPQATLQYS